MKTSGKNYVTKNKTTMTKHITEIIPNFDKLPDWAREAFKDGRYFAVVSEKVIEYEARLKAEETEGSRNKDYLNSDDVIEIVRRLKLAEATIKAIDAYADELAEPLTSDAAKGIAGVLKAIIKENKDG